MQKFSDQPTPLRECVTDILRIQEAGTYMTDTNERQGSFDIQQRIEAARRRITSPEGEQGAIRALEDVAAAIDRLQTIRCVDERRLHEPFTL
jgi:hypothetical protein